MKLAKLGKPSACIGQERPKIQGKNHPNWKGGEIITWNGYKKVFINGEYILEHHLVWLRDNQLYRIPDTCLIHHLDLNKLNNHISNLQLMPDIKHGRFHAQLQGNMIGINHENSL